MEPLVGHRYLGIPEGSYKFQTEERHLVKSWREMNRWKVSTGPDEKVLQWQQTQTFQSGPCCILVLTKCPTWAPPASVGDRFLLKLWGCPLGR